MQYIYVEDIEIGAISLTVPLPLGIPPYDRILLLWRAFRLCLRGTGTIRDYADPK